MFWKVSRAKLGVWSLVEEVTKVTGGEEGCFSIGLPSCVDFHMHTWDDWALAAYHFLCQVAVCQQLPGAHSLILDMPEIFIVSKITSKAIGGRRMQCIDLYFPCCTVGNNEVPYMGPYCRKQKASQLANLPLAPPNSLSMMLKCSPAWEFCDKERKYTALINLNCF